MYLLLTAVYCVDSPVVVHLLQGAAPNLSHLPSFVPSCLAAIPGFIRTTASTLAPAHQHVPLQSTPVGL